MSIWPAYELSNLVIIRSTPLVRAGAHSGWPLRVAAWLCLRCCEPRPGAAARRMAAVERDADGRAYVVESKPVSTAILFLISLCCRIGPWRLP